MNLTVEKAVQWVTLAAVLLGLAASAATCSRAFDKIEEHEKRLGAIEADAKARGELLSTKLGQLQTSTDYLNWRMDAVTKAIEKQQEKKR